MNETTKCYECENEVPVGQLSPRSRCVLCEHRRAVFNEKENEKLRAELSEVKR